MLAAEIIRRVKEIQIRTGRQVADVLAGGYVSVFRGTGIEFDEVRPYVPGDDTRTIDWNVTARTGQPHVKRYVEERELTLMLMADVSASQDFGSLTSSKRETTAELCALLAFSAIRNNDKVGLVLFHGDVEHYIPPRKGQRHALRVVREVLAHGESNGLQQDAILPRHRGWRNLWHRVLKMGGVHSLQAPRQSTNIARAAEFLLSVSKRKTVCFVVSDFMDSGYEKALSLANKRHDVIAVLVSDPHELQLPDVGLVSLRDAESGETRVYDTGSEMFRETVAQMAANRVAHIEFQLRQRGIDFIHVTTSEPVVEPLVRFFKMREKRSRR